MEQSIRTSRKGQIVHFPTKKSQAHQIETNSGKTILRVDSGSKGAKEQS